MLHFQVLVDSIDLTWHHAAKSSHLVTNVMTDRQTHTRTHRHTDKPSDRVKNIIPFFKAIKKIFIGMIFYLIVNKMKRKTKLPNSTYHRWHRMSYLPCRWYNMSRIPLCSIRNIDLTLMPPQGRWQAHDVYCLGTSKITWQQILISFIKAYYCNNLSNLLSENYAIMLWIEDSPYPLNRATF